MQVAFGVTASVIVNAAVSHAFVVRGHGWLTACTQFGSMAANNVGAVAILLVARNNLRADVNPGNTLFLVLLTVC